MHTARKATAAMQVARSPIEVPLCVGCGLGSYGGDCEADRAWERHQLIHSPFHPFHLSPRRVSILLGVVKVL